MLQGRSHWIKGAPNVRPLYVALLPGLVSCIPCLQGKTVTTPTDMSDSWKDFSLQQTTILSCDSSESVELNKSWHTLGSTVLRTVTGLGRGDSFVYPDGNRSHNGFC